MSKIIGELSEEERGCIDARNRLRDELYGTKDPARRDELLREIEARTREYDRMRLARWEAGDVR